MPVATMVREIVDIEGNEWQVKSSFDTGYRRVRLKLPAVLTVTRDLNVPRTLSFSGIIKARKKEITQWGLSDLGLSADSVGLNGSPTIVSSLATKENRREAEILSGTRDEKADVIVQKLADEGVL